MVERTYMPGLDILKYFMALLIVAGHSDLFVEFPYVNAVFGNLPKIAIPTFFAVSAFLFFGKLDNSPQDATKVFKHTIKRLLIFYIVWYVLMLPYSIPNSFMKANFKELLFVVPFGCAFKGYWFIKALIINTVILYLCRGKRALGICTIIALIIYL